ncbi:MAG: hypothetical protein AAGD01_04305 [Acidobacteriota bacterium]
MPIITIVYGLLLILLGVVGYFATGQESVTALIPTFFGVPVLISGFIARNEARLKHAMHAAATLALLGLFGTITAIPQAFSALTGGGEAGAAVLSRATMGILSLVFVVLCVRSFIAARRAREQG